MKIPITKTELIEKYGEEPIFVDWYKEKMIVTFRDIICTSAVQIFYSKFELAMELNKIYNRLRRGLF
jgi:hypothetical protein